MKKVLISETTLKQIHEGNKRAFEQLYHAYYEHLCRFANAICHDKDIAEEIVDNVMLGAWNNRENLHYDTLWPYLIKATRNGCFTRIKSKDFHNLKHIVSLSEEGQELLQIISDSKSPLGWIVENELDQQMNDIIASLPPMSQKVFRMSREEGLNYQEIANKLNITKNTVKYHISYALNTIRENLIPTILLALIIIQVIKENKV